MGIVCMVNSTALLGANDANYTQKYLDSPLTENLIGASYSDEQCPSRIDPQKQHEKGYQGTLLWSQSMQAQLFSSVFIGSLVTILFSGYLADRFGPKLLVTIAILDYSLVSLLTPFLATNSFYAYLFARFIMGLAEVKFYFPYSLVNAIFQGFVFPCNSSVSARWIPPDERSFMASFYTMGNQWASVFGLLVASRLCSLEWLGGWPLIFYSFGIVGLVGVLLWNIFFTDSPADNCWISDEERWTIEASLKSESSKGNASAIATTSAKEICVVGDRHGYHSKRLSKGPVPWRSMVTSPAVYAILVGNFSYSFTAVLLQSYLPTYFKEALKMDLKQNGAFSVIPFAFQLAAKLPYGWISDTLKRKRILSSTAASKVFNSIGSFGCAFSFLMIAYFADCTNVVLVGIMLAIYGICFAGGISGFYTSMLCVAPAYTGTLSSLSLFFSYVGNALAPTVVAFFNKTGSSDEWALIWCVVAVLNILGGIFFLIYGSADIQPWAMSDDNPSKVHSEPTELRVSVAPSSCHKMEQIT
ncbi:major facilitator superfamily domain-containing protein [Ditylenchus destructor]|uniref:Major facilitator superfamily domain-containing protein n=1 Tax=Ditylenchus destructor TaxID=166010 RepID=A0AAD4N238_9BILA|nr:major facilitator superfamily domain-containing protein [Ditylenchus destructor]